MAHAMYHRQQVLQQQAYGRRQACLLAAVPAAAVNNTPSGVGIPVQGAVLQLTCERLALGGKGVCFQQGSAFVILCEKALPGERLLARIERVLKGYAEAIKLESLAPHRHAVRPACPHFGACGGCTLQSMSYEAQLAEKHNQVLQTLMRVGNLANVRDVMLPILGCGGVMYMPSQQTELQQGQQSYDVLPALQDSMQEEQQAQDGGSSGQSAHEPNHQPNTQTQLGQTQLGQYGYRNKLQFTFSNIRWLPPAHASQIMDTSQQQSAEAVQERAWSEGSLAHEPTLGFVRPGTVDQALAIDRCHLAPPAASHIMATVSVLAAELGLQPTNATGVSPDLACLHKVIVRRAAEAWPPRSGAAEIAVQPTAAAPPPPPLKAPLERAAAAPPTERAAGAAPPADAVGTAATPAVADRQGTQATACSDDGVYMVVIVTNATARVDLLKCLAQQLMAEIPQVTGVVHKQMVTKGNSASGSGGSTGKAQAAGGGKKQKTRVHVKQDKLPFKKSSASNSMPSNARSPPEQPKATDEDDGEANIQGGSNKTTVLAGVGHLVEHLCGLRFRLSADSFFQTNTAQAEVLYKAVARAAQLQPTDTLLDLYCGTGSIGLSLAHQCKHVLGYEAVEAAVVDARFNAQLNAITNASFICGDLDAGLSEPHTATGRAHTTTTTATTGRARVNGSDGLDVEPAATAAWRSPAEAAALSVWRKPDVVVVNPARAGLSAAIIQYLRQCKARRVVYVSCNAATQARDLALLCQPSSLSTQDRSLSTGDRPLSTGDRSLSTGDRPLSTQDRPISTGDRSPSRGDRGGKKVPSPHRIKPAAKGNSDQFFKLVSVQACDLFPHTDHVENIAVLDRVA